MSLDNAFFRIWTVLLALFLVVATCAWAAPVMLFDVKSQAMGGIGMAGWENPLSYAHNPASLVFAENQRPFSTSVVWSNSIDGEAFSKKEPNPFLCSPYLTGNLWFAGPNAALSLVISSFLKTKDSSPDSSFGIYDSMKCADLQFSAAYGWKNFSFGIAIDGGDFSRRQNIKIHANSSFADYMLQTQFERHKRMVGSEFISISLGMMAKIDGFSMGLTFGELTSKQEDGNISLSGASMAKTMSFGLHYSGPKYNRKTDMLSVVVPNVGIEVHNAFFDFFKGYLSPSSLPAADEKKRQSELCVGAELMFQLSPNLSICLMTGLKSGSFAGNFTGDAVHTIGLSVTGERFQANVQAGLPFALYRGDSKKAYVNLGLDWKY